LVARHHVLKKKDAFQRLGVHQFGHVVDQVLVRHDVLKKKDRSKGVECISSDMSSIKLSSVAACSG
jgi:hypothetical protein